MAEARQPLFPAVLPGSDMLLVPAFLFQALANFAAALLLARALGAEAYGSLALAAAAAGAVAVPALEWLRHAATRFAGDADPARATSARATIDAAAVAVTVVVGLALGLVCLVPVPFAGLRPAPAWTLAFAAAFVVAGALFDIQAATLRARDRARAYAALVSGRAAAVLAAMVATALVVSEPAAVLAAGTAASAGAFLAARLVLRRAVTSAAGAGSRPGPGAAPSARLALAFARYGLPLVAAGAIALVQAYANRAALAGSHGLAAAGQFALAWDIGIRIVAALGTAADVLLLQKAVRAAEAQGGAAGRAQAGRNALVVAGLLLPAAAGVVAVMPALEPLLVDASFRGPFGRDAALLMPGLLAWGLMQFALAAPFQVAGRTWPLVLPGLLGLAGNGLLAVVLPGPLAAAGLDPAAAQALAFSLGMVPALGLSTWLAVHRGGIALPRRDLAAVALATAAMAAYAALIARSGPAWSALPLAVAGGGSLYAWLLVLLDVGGLGSALRRRGRRAAAA